ncbi:site-2 protease family protein [Candidatus Nitrosotalea bavarica]|uniref:site-2 protease family protein n=1 Tax=Candidatus Nitrosotalea bavarica TaxID=1903277 RepID=UPI000C70DDDD|nr:site-2 protease family protein [Candidatus Nitrosotalea bavarica]
MSLQIGHIKGISIRLHFTLIITFVLIDWTLSTYFMPDYVKGLRPVSYWLMGSAGSVLLFFSILLHELAHSMVAKRYNIPVKSITLFIFGGVSDIAKEPTDFHQEFKMSIAGPLASFALGGIFAFFYWAVSSESSGNVISYLAQIKGVLFYAAMANIILGAFNLVPAFPLDGGRVLRAALVRWKKDYHDATKIATSIGVLISYAFMGLGFMILINGDFVGGLWILLIGWFLHNGAQSYMSQFELTSALKGIIVGNIMNTEIISVRRDMSLDFVLENFFMTSMKSELPVTDERGYLLGMITLKDTLNIPENKRGTVTVQDIMIQTEHLAIMQPDTEVEKAFIQMVQKRVGKIFVCDKDGKLFGVVSKTDIIELASERQKYLREIKRTSS